MKFTTLLLAVILTVSNDAVNASGTNDNAPKLLNGGIKSATKEDAIISDEQRGIHMIAMGEEEEMMVGEPKEERNGGDTDAAVVAAGAGVMDQIPDNDNSNNAAGVDEEETTSNKRSRSEKSDDDNGSIISIIANNNNHITKALFRSLRQVVAPNAYYFPDWAGLNTCKLDEDDAPTYMRQNPSAWMKYTLQDCCQRYYSWDYYQCISSSTSLATTSESGEGGRMIEHTKQSPPPQQYREPPRHTTHHPLPGRSTPPRHTTRQVPPRRRRLRGGTPD